MFFRIGGGLPLPMRFFLKVLANYKKRCYNHISRIGTSDIIFGYNGRDGVVTDKNGLIYMRARYYSIKELDFGILLPIFNKY